MLERFLGVLGTNFGSPQTFGCFLFRNLLGFYNVWRYFSFVFELSQLFFGLFGQSLILD